MMEQGRALFSGSRSGYFCVAGEEFEFDDVMDHAMAVIGSWGNFGRITA